MPTHVAEQWSTATNTGHLPILDGEGCGDVGSPHVEGLRDDRAVVVTWTAGAAAWSPPRGRSRASAGAPAPSTSAPGMAQPRPHLAVALAVKRAAREHLPDRLDEVLSGIGPRAPAGVAARMAPSPPAATVDACPGHAPDPADPGDTVAAGVEIDDGAHRFDPRRKGAPPASSRAIFDCRSSVSMVSSPTLVRSRSIVSSPIPRPRLQAQQSRRRGRRRASRSESAAVTASSRATSSSARLAGAATPPPACDPPSSAAPGPEPDRPISEVSAPAAPPLSTSSIQAPPSRLN